MCAFPKLDRHTDTLIFQNWHAPLWHCPSAADILYPWIRLSNKGQSINFGLKKLKLNSFLQNITL